MAERVECVVIGAGAVGLACARRLAMAGLEVVVLEAAEAIGTETSSRNSEVIHAGIYYPAGSFKAKACVAGKHFLYDYCGERGVAHKRIGKLIVAGDESRIPELEALQARAAANGVPDLELLTGAEVRALEPAVQAQAGLLSPSTGIVDSHALMLAFQGDAEELGAMIAFHAPVVCGRAVEDGIEIEVGGAEPMTLAAGLVVNSAGLAAPEVARRIDGLDARHIPKARFAKGNYFSVAGRQPLPPPGLSDAGGLRAGRACHTRPRRPVQVRPRPRMAGGPRNTMWTRPARTASTTPCGATIRGSRTARCSRPMPASGRRSTAPARRKPDFLLQGPETHGVPGLVNLFGIESPGLTASPAIADEVARLAGAAR